MQFIIFKIMYRTIRNRTYIMWIVFSFFSIDIGPVLFPDAAIKSSDQKNSCLTHNYVEVYRKLCGEESLDSKNSDL